MRALHLDYRATRPQSAMAVLLLACGFALAVAALLNFQYAAQESAKWEAELAAAQSKLERSARNPSKEHGDTQQRAEEVAAANAVIRQLNLPWEDMFNAFELATNDEVALLGIEPDAKKKMVKITAESKTAEGMLNYIKRLQQAALLDDVLLQKHELQTRDPEKPLRFIVTSTWKDRG
jgi:hypothetical protein